MKTTSLPLRILLVEDNEHDRLVFRRAFEKRQVTCEITECMQAEEALEILRADALRPGVPPPDFDLLAIDHGLPGLSGFDLCKQLADKDSPWALVLLTGVGSEKLAAEALQAGVDDYIIKDSGGGYLELLPVVLQEACQKHSGRLASQKSEAELKESNRRLAEILAERQQTTQRHQQERLCALGRMSRGISHCFNNVLTPISGYIDLMLMVPGALDDQEKMKCYLELMNTTTKEATEIIGNLQNFHRQRAGSDIFMPVNLAQLVEETIELTRPKWQDQALASGTTISMVKDLHEVPPVSGNETDLRQALTNLIFNAVEAISKDGTITIRTRHDEPQPTKEPDLNCVILEVSDTGAGMTAEVQQHCFEPFFSTKDEHGAGMGLAMVHGIVHRHAGTIDIKSQESKGTTFIIRLPIQKETPVEGEGGEAEVATRPLSVGEREDKAGLHVLLVEDRPMVRDVITEYLRVDGHTVETATNGREGLKQFCVGKFDVVITDRDMPDMNGDELAAALKQLAPKQDVIMLTGYGDMMTYVSEIPEGIDDLLGKPITLSDFREALAKSRARRAKSQG